MLKIGFTGIWVFITFCLNAQTLTTSSRSWQYLTGGAVVAPDSIWDEPSYFPIADQLIDLDFTFHAFGKPMDSLWLDQGGILSLDEEVWMGVWEDLCDKAFGKRKSVSPIRIVKSGTTGNKKVEIEWRNFGFYGQYNFSGSCTDSANLRMTISEKNQSVEMWFGPSYITNPTADFPKGVVIFLDRLDSFQNATGIDLKGNPAAPLTVPVNETNHSFLDSWPANGTVYTFTFPNAKIPKNYDKKVAYYFEGMITTDDHDWKLDVLDISGKNVWTKSFRNATELPALKPGIYILELNSGLKQETLKIYIQ